MTGFPLPQTTKRPLWLNLPAGAAPETALLLTQRRGAVPDPDAALVPRAHCLRDLGAAEVSGAAEAALAATTDFRLKAHLRREFGLA